MAAEKGNKYAEGNDGGRPALFNNEDDLQAKVDAYFEANPVGTRTITGLALFLGFESRQSLYDYEKNDMFSYIIKRARLQVENSYETMLYGKNAAGPIFALKNMNWRDSSAVDHTTNGKDIGATIDISKMSNEEIDFYYKMHEKYKDAGK